jgi:hypothetical protein
MQVEGVETRLLKSWQTLSKRASLQKRSSMSLAGGDAEGEEAKAARARKEAAAKAARTRKRHEKARKNEG